MIRFSSSNFVIPSSSVKKYSSPFFSHSRIGRVVYGTILCKSNFFSSKSSLYIVSFPVELFPIRQKILPIASPVILHSLTLYTEFLLLYTSSTRIILVFPETPKGTPAVITTVSPFLTYPASTALRTPSLNNSSAESFLSI